MIGSIKGKIREKLEGALVVEVDGVGYRVFVPSDLYTRSQKNQDIFLLTHLHVREDALTLFGFTSRKKLQFFKLLLGVSGIGPKMALAILSTYPVTEIQEAITTAKAEIFQAISGIGKKNAQRIIIDLQPKLGALEELEFAGDQAKLELLEALKSLGYTAKEAREALQKVDSRLKEEEQLKQALRILAG